MSREIVYWDVANKEYLTHACKEEAIEYILDDIDGPLPKVIEICGYARMDTGLEPGPLADTILEDLLEKVDEEYGSPDESFEPTDEMVEAAKELAKTFIDGYVPWACEIVARESVDVAEWVEKHMPHWMEDEK